MERTSPAFSVAPAPGDVAQPVKAVVQSTESPADALRLSQRSASECLARLEGPGLNPVLRVFKLDESAQTHVRRLIEHLVETPRGEEGRWLSDWRSGRGFFDTLSCAYLEALRTRAPGGVAKTAIHAELLARLIRAGANLLKWDYLRYGPVETELWGFIGAAYLEAERAGMLQMLVSLRKDRGTQTSIEREFLRAVALGCASMDQLSPDGMEIADRLIRYVLPAMRISRQARPGACFGLQIGSSALPVRAPKGIASCEFQHYFVPSAVGGVFDELASVIERGLVPAAIATGARARERVLATLFHLRRLWSDTPPMRRYRRHELSARLGSVCGFDNLSACLLGGGLSSNGPEWVLRDVSRGGVGLTVSVAQSNGVRVNELVGLRMVDGAGWHVGVIRRIVQSAEDAVFVGVELIGRDPALVLADDGRAASEVLLCDPVRPGRTVRLAGPAEALPVNSVVYLNFDGRVVKLRPIALLVRGNGFVLRNYQLL